MLPKDTIFYHGTKASFNIGDMMSPGFMTNYGTGKKSNNIYFSATLEAATWGAELAQGEGRGRIYIVEPTGDYENDPNLTDKKFPGNPTKSFRSKSPLKVVGEVKDWIGHAPELIQTRLDNIAKLNQQGIEAIDD